MRRLVSSVDRVGAKESYVKVKQAGFRKVLLHMKFPQFALMATTLALAVLAGRVTDATTGQPLPNVTIAIGSHRTNTDKHGAYRLTGLTPGHYTLSASSNDVPPQHRTVVVKQNGGQATLNLVLCSTTLDYNCGGAAPGPG